MYFMSLRELHALASTPFSSPARRARDAAFFLGDFCGVHRSQIRVRWQRHAVEMSVKVFDQKLDGGAGQKDIDAALDVVGYVHGFRVLSKTQQGANVVLKLSTTIARMDESFARARRVPALKSMLEAVTIGVLLYFVTMALWHGRVCWWCTLEEEEESWEVDDEPG